MEMHELDNYFQKAQLFREALSGLYAIFVGGGNSGVKLTVLSIFHKFFLLFSLAFLGFSLDFCKGRISSNTVQIYLKSAQNHSLVDFHGSHPTISSKYPQKPPKSFLPLSIFFVFTPRSPGLPRRKQRKAKKKHYIPSGFPRYV